jgi:hypothetical protein
MLDIFIWFVRGIVLMVIRPLSKIQYTASTLVALILMYLRLHYKCNVGFTDLVLLAVVLIIPILAGHVKLD